MARSGLTAVLTHVIQQRHVWHLRGLWRDTAIRLISTDQCHPIISLHYYSFFRAFERYFLTVNRKIFILFTFNAIMQIVKSKLHSFQI